MKTFQQIAFDLTEEWAEKGLIAFPPDDPHPDEVDLAFWHEVRRRHEERVEPRE